MVMDNRGTPDPENPSGNLSPNNEFIMTNDTDTEDEDNPSNNDYQPLPAHDGATGFNSVYFQAVSSSEDDDDNEDEAEIIDAETTSAVSGETPLPPITRAETEIVNELWAGPSPKVVDIEMDSTKVDEVKQAMQNITLPPGSIPEWATNVPEAQWKERLMSRLEDLKKSD